MRRSTNTTRAQGRGKGSSNDEVNPSKFSKIFFDILIRFTNLEMAAMNRLGVKKIEAPSGSEDQLAQRHFNETRLCTVLYCVLLYCTVFHCIALCFIVFYLWYRIVFETKITATNPYQLNNTSNPQK